MQELYEKILKKPKAYRRKVAYILTIVFGLMLFSLWMFIAIDSFKQQLGEIKPGETLQKGIPSLKEKYESQETGTAEIKKGLEDLGY